MHGYEGGSIPPLSAFLYYLKWGLRGMSDERIYKKQCPYCHNWINVSDLLPDKTKICFFAEFTMTNGVFSNGRCFPSINNSVRKKAQKRIDDNKINFDESFEEKDILED